MFFDCCFSDILPSKVLLLNYPSYSCKWVCTFVGMNKYSPVAFGEFFVKKILHNIALRFIIILFFINVQIMGQYPQQCAPFQVAGFLNAWQISKKLGCLSNQSSPSGHMKKKLPHQAHDVKTTSYWHQCDVVRSNWRQYDVILTSYTCWDAYKTSQSPAGTWRPINVDATWFTSHRRRYDVILPFYLFAILKQVRQLVRRTDHLPLSSFLTVRQYIVCYIMYTIKCKKVQSNLKEPQLEIKVER